MTISFLWSNTVSGLHLPPDRIQARKLTGGQDSVSRCSVACTALIHKHVALFQPSCHVFLLLWFPSTSFLSMKWLSLYPKVSPTKISWPSPRVVSPPRRQPEEHSSSAPCLLHPLPSLSTLTTQVLSLLVTAELLCVCLVVSPWAFNM